jgi:hypothetical protein
MPPISRVIHIGNFNLLGTFGLRVDVHIWNIIVHHWDLSVVIFSTYEIKLIIYSFLCLSYPKITMLTFVPLYSLRPLIMSKVCNVPR